MTRKLRRVSARGLQPLDRLAWLAMVGLGLVAGVLLWGGQVCARQACGFLDLAPKVAEFSWQDLTIGAQDTAFILGFDRVMERRSVEENLEIQPALQGKYSWSGRRLAYTLTAPAPYGQTFQLLLKKANSQDDRSQLKPFQGEFRSRDRAFA